MSLIQVFWIKNDSWVSAWSGSGRTSSDFATVWDDWNIVVSHFISFLGREDGLQHASQCEPQLNHLLKDYSEKQAEEKQKKKSEKDKSHSQKVMA